MIQFTKIGDKMYKFLSAFIIAITLIATPALARPYHGGGHWGGGHYRGGHYNYHNNFWVAPAIIGGTILGSALIYNGTRYNDAVEYCRARYRSYDPYSQTYLGKDGWRHPCP